MVSTDTTTDGVLDVPSNPPTPSLPPDSGGVGNDLNLTEKRNHFRILARNINGIPVGAKSAAWKEHFSTMRELGVDVFAFWKSI